MSNEHSAWSREQIEALGVLTNIPTVAKILGISRSQAYLLASEGRLPFPVHYVGSRIRVPTSGLLAWLDASREAQLP